MQPRWAAYTSLCHLCQPSAIQWLHSGGSQQRLRLSTPSTLGGWDAVLVWWWQKKIQAYSPRNITRLVEKKRYLQKGAGQRDLSRGAGLWRVWWCVAGGGAAKLPWAAPIVAAAGRHAVHDSDATRWSSRNRRASSRQRPCCCPCCPALLVPARRSGAPCSGHGGSRARLGSQNDAHCRPDKRQQCGTWT